MNTFMPCSSDVSSRSKRGECKGYVKSLSLLPQPTILLLYHSPQKASSYHSAAILTHESETNQLSEIFKNIYSKSLVRWIRDFEGLTIVHKTYGTLQLKLLYIMNESEVETPVIFATSCVKNSSKPNSLAMMRSKKL